MVLISFPWGSFVGTDTTPLQSLNEESGARIQLAAKDDAGGDPIS
jgi:hypothetical protein